MWVGSDRSLTDENEEIGLALVENRTESGSPIPAELDVGLASISATRLGDSVFEEMDLKICFEHGKSGSLGAK